MKMKHTFREHGLAVAAVAILITLIGCNAGDTNAHANGGTASDPNRAALFSIPPDQLSHVQVISVQPATLTRELRLTGAVAYNADYTTPVITQVSGPVNRIVVSPGQQVRKGAPMLYIASPDYSQMRANYLKAKDAALLAQKNLERTQDLYKHNAAAVRDVEQAQSAEIQAQADLTAAESALRVLGVINPEQLAANPPSPEVPVWAPIGGEVVEKLVSPGQLLQAGQTQCFTISNMNSVWVLVNVYQKDLPFVRVSDEVTIQTDAYPEAFNGRISYIAAALDPNTRTLQARIVTRNPGEKLKKDMYVTAVVRAGTVKNAIAVPDAAVLRDTENEPFVYAEVSPNQFGKRSVTVGDSSNGQMQVLSGLKPGDRVIGDGSLFLQFANSLQR
jgi:cobalt-zinc-cadmium efflux system membrane fusion protein